MDEMYLPAIWLLMAIIGYPIGRTRGRGRGAFGFFMGLLLGPVGWLLVICLPKAAPPSQNPFRPPDRL